MSFYAHSTDASIVHDAHYAYASERIMQTHQKRIDCALCKCISDALSALCGCIADAYATHDANA